MLIANVEKHTIVFKKYLFLFRNSFFFVGNQTKGRGHQHWYAEVNEENESGRKSSDKKKYFGPFTRLTSE